MLIRIDIDDKDIASVLRETRKRFDRSAYEFMFSAGALTLIGADSAIKSWRTIGAIFTAGELSFGVFYPAIAAVAVLALCVFTMAAIVEARRRGKRATLEEAKKAGFSIGRFEYLLSEECLIIRGPLVVKKIVWSNFERVESKKENIILWRKNGLFEFIPKNVIKNEDELLAEIAKHSDAIKKSFSFSESPNAKPLSVMFEFRDSDMDDFYSHHDSMLDGKFNFLRRIYYWPPLKPFLFAACVAISGFALYAAINMASFVSAGVSFVFAAAAAGLFITNASYFRGPAFPAMKKAPWPYAQAELMNVTLSEKSVHFSRRGQSEILQWAAFEDYYETRLYAYLIVAQNHVIPIPKRAFLGKEHFKAFSGYAKQNILRAQRQMDALKRDRLMRSLGQQSENEQVKSADAA